MVVKGKAKKRPTYKQKQKSMTKAQREHRAEKMRLYMKRSRAAAKGLPSDVVPLDGKAFEIRDERIERELALRKDELLSESKKLAEEMGLKLGRNGLILVNRDNMRKLYQRTYDSEDALDDEDGDDEDLDLVVSWQADRKKKANAWAPHILIRKYLRYHFKKRPFDKIRLGILKVVDKSGSLVWMELHDEQSELLDYVEHTWYNGLPCMVIILKARQIGSSTFWTAVHYCYQTTQSNKKSNVVLEYQDKSEEMVAKFRQFLEYEPYWMRPSIYREKPLRLKGAGVKGAVVKVQSSERREKVSRSETFQFNHLSEIPYWADPKATFNSMMASVQLEWPLIHVEESTGKNIGDVFYEKFMAAYEGKRAQFKAFFFEWFRHKAYRKELPRGVRAEDFRNSLAQDDLDMWDKYNLTAEQVYWYTNRREMEVTAGEATPELFKREFPCCIADAFLGSSTNFFDPKKNKADTYRTRMENRMRVSGLDDLPKSASGYWQNNMKLGGNDNPMKYGRFSLKYDAHKGFKDCSLLVDSGGPWYVWEKPRPMHKYVVTVDIASGKQAEKGASAKTDYSVIDVWRYTYEMFEPPMAVQVAQYRERTDSFELAELAVAISEIYKDSHGTGDRCLICPENNFGEAFVEEVKRMGGWQYQRVTYGKTGEEIGRQLGFRTTTGGANAAGSKVYLLQRFRGQWASNKVLINSHYTALEMGVFVNDDGKMGAMPGHHDDTVIAAALMPEAVKYIEGDPDPKLIEVKMWVEDVVKDVMGDIPEQLDVQAYYKETLEAFGVKLLKEANRRNPWL